MLYPQNFEQKIGFAEIRNLLHQHCLSTMGRQRVDEMQFISQPALVRHHHAQVSEYRQIMTEEDQLPEQDFYDMRPAIQHMAIEGTFIEEDDMWHLCLALRTLHAWVALIRQNDEQSQIKYPALQQVAQGVFTFHSVTRRIEEILDKYGHIKDDASQPLAAIRRELHHTESNISHTLQSILRTAQQQGLVEKDVAPTLREGRLVIPVAPAMKRRLRGIVHDESATGKTIFIEPAEVVEANNRIRELKAEERREIIRILREFSAMLRPNTKELLRGFAFLAEIEFIRAKARLAEQFNAISPQIADKPQIDWVQARHPLLQMALARQGKKIVPLDLQLNHTQRILIISGPNAGGKSVCLKTAGLLQYMLQCGLPIPLRENSKCGIFRHLFIDIGDQQSIEDDLSTYSSHLLNMKHFMRNADASTLLLIDEFGSGTEPTIGGALAEAMMKRFVEQKAYGIITTHYQNLKQYGEATTGVVNGAMLYDRQHMQALFQLQTGNPGSSFAVEIARKIGIPEGIIADATEIVGREYVAADKYLLDITRDKRYWEHKRQTIHTQEKQLEQSMQQLQSEADQLQQQRRDIIRQAKEEARQILQQANAQIENTIREIREAQAEKERTKQARQQIDDMRLQLEAQQEADRDERIARKMQQIAQRKERKKNKTSKATSADPSASAATASSSATAASSASAASSAQAASSATAATALAIGDTCRIKGQSTTGIISGIEGKKAIVTFGMMKTTVDLSRLTAAKPAATAPTATMSRQTQDSVREKHLQFHPEIDVRGMRAEEALQAVSYFMDDTLLVGAHRVRILHGTGNGILRQLIRQHLKSLPYVHHAADEDVRFGGAGITVVEL